MNVLSLFNGKGGAIAALKQANIRVNKFYASEIDKYASAVNDYHHPETINLGDVTKVNFMGLPPIDLLIAGFPCQAFSMAGKQLNFDDPRGKLFFEVVRLIQELKPKYFLLENVKMKKDILAEINRLVGIEPILINSAKLSAQNRERNYWVARLNDNGVYERIEIKQPEDKGILLKDIVEDGFVDREKSLTVTTRVNGATKERYLNKSMHQMIKVANVNPSGNGMNGNVYSIDGKAPTLTTNKGEGVKITGGAMRGRYLDENGKRLDSTVKSQKGLTEQRIELREDGKSNCLTTVGKDSLCIQIGEANINSYRERKAVYSIHGKCPTLLTPSGGYSEKKISQDGLTWRKVTPVECERLQTYSDNYTQYGIMNGSQVTISNSQRYKILGNGFTRDVIVHILNEMKLLN